MKTPKGPSLCQSSLLRPALPPSVSAPVPSMCRHPSPIPQMMPCRTSRPARPPDPSSPVLRRGQRQEERRHPRGEIGKGRSQQGHDRRGRNLFHRKVTLGKDTLTFEAKIAESEEVYIDAREVLKQLGGDIEKFLSIASVTKTALENAHGKNMVLLCEKKRTKPAELKVSKAK